MDPTTTSTDLAEDKIKLYTSLASPSTHRVAIVLHELSIPHTTEQVDISVPRTPSYLAISPRGLCPALTIPRSLIPHLPPSTTPDLAESAIIAQFLAEAYGGAHPTLWPSGGVETAWRRAKMNFFMDTFATYIYPLYGGVVGAPTLEAQEKGAREYVDAVAKWLEPLLQDCGEGGTGAFFGGADGLTMAEVVVLPITIRLYTMSREGIFPKWIPGEMEKKAPRFDRWAKNGFAHASVKAAWDEETNVHLNRWFAETIVGRKE